MLNMTTTPRGTRSQCFAILPSIILFLFSNRLASKIMLKNIPADKRVTIRIADE